jgi:cytochrome c-type biogenesis protein CcmH/NrfG
MAAAVVSASEENEAIERLEAADAATPLDAAGLADLVGLLAKARRDREAAAYAARLLALRPTHRRALRALTRAPPPGVDVTGGWRALAQTAPDDPEPWLQIARLAARAGEAATALEACDAVLARAADHPEALSLKLGALSALKAHGGVGEVWEALRRADPERAWALVARAGDEADLDAAASMLGEAGSQGLLDADGEHQRLRLRARLMVLAFEAELAGDDIGAVRYFAGLARLEPAEADHADGVRRALPRLRARIDAADGEPPAELAEAAGALIAFEPEHAGARLVLGRALARAGDWRGAAEALSAALRLGGASDGALLLEHAAACGRSGRLTEAVASWERAARLAGAERTARAAASRAAAELGAMAEAAHARAVEAGDWRAAWAAHHALAALDDDPAAVEGRAAALLKATAKALSGAADDHRAETVDLARLYLNHAPDDVRARLFLGRALSRERRNAEALAIWRGLADERPDSAEPWLQIARLAKRLEQPDLGRRAAGALLALEPGHAEGHGLLAYFDEPGQMG